MRLRPGGPGGPAVRARMLCVGVALAALIVPATAHASAGMLVGAAEDAGKQPTLAGAKAQMDLAKLAGLGAIRLLSLIHI